MFFYYVYVLESVKDSNRYVGFTTHLKQRVEEHNNKSTFSTKTRIPFTLIYFEACTNKKDAMRREHYLKTTGGRRFLAKRLREYYSSKL